MCGLDTLALKREYREFCGVLKDWQLQLMPNPKSWEERFPWLRERGIPYSRVSKRWWDADHIIPVSEGGGECGPDGYRTLCIPCHRRVTRELRGRLKAARPRAEIRG